MTDTLTFIDGRDALAFVLIRPGETPDAVAIESSATGLSKTTAASILHFVAGQWERETAPATQPVVSAAVAAHVLWSEGHGGHPAGDFITKLLAAWATADDDNHDRLATAYPEYAAAIALMRQPGGQGIAQLQTIATS